MNSETTLLALVEDLNAANKISEIVPLLIQVLV